jgi:hypothetical protein
MTIQELHHEFYLLSNKIGGNERRSFSVAEIDWLLNKAQRIIIDQYTDMFELNQKRIHDLGALHIKLPLQPAIACRFTGSTIQTNNGLFRIYEVYIPALSLPYYSFTKVSGRINKANCVYRAIGRYIDNDDFEEAIKSSFDVSEESFFFNIGRASNYAGNVPLVEDNKKVSMYIYTPYIIENNEIFIEYIKEPKPMNYGGYIYLDDILTVRQECELPTKLHNKLVDIAIALAFNTMNDQAYALKKDILNSLSE